MATKAENSASPMAELPEVSGDAARLLSALLVRLSCKHPYRGWTIPRWRDPSRDPSTSRLVSMHLPLEGLSGTGGVWRLDVTHRSVAQALTASIIDTTIGLGNSHAVSTSTGYEIQFGSASLNLRSSRDDRRDTN